jgi:WD40 repeat protein
VTKQENRNTGAAAAGQGQQQKASPWAEQLVMAALPHAPKDGSMEAKAEFLRGLVEKLKAFMEFEKWDSRPVESVVVKRGYREVESLKGHTQEVPCLQALPDGRIVSGSHDRTLPLRVWTRSSDGKWSSEVLSGHTRQVNCLQALPDGRIVSGSYDNTLRVWTRGSDGKWSSEVLSGHARHVTCLQAIPDGRIMSGSFDGSIRIWDGTPVERSEP